jgi:xanthine dehydrogenase accessory factor
MSDALLDELMAARSSRTPCALVTIAATRGSVPRAAGSKMLVYATGSISGTVGGGKFESLVIDDAHEQMRAKKPLLKNYPLHESSTESFGAICGGEVTVFIEPQHLSEAIFLIGGGHCALAVGKLALECGLFVTVVDDRPEVLKNFPTQIATIGDVDPAKFIAERNWQADEALIILSRHHEIDRDALAAALQTGGTGYIGMIGSKRKVQHVFDQLKERGLSKELDKVYAPLGLDIGADSPSEIAVSIIGEVLSVLRKRSARHFRDSAAAQK